MEGAGLVPWVGHPLDASVEFYLRKHSKARPTQKRYYCIHYTTRLTRVVRHWYVIGIEEQQLYCSVSLHSTDISVFWLLLPLSFPILGRRWTKRQRRGRDVTVSFVRSLLRAGVQPTLDPSAVGPMRQPRERRGIGRCVRCMCELCRVEEGLSRHEQLVRYF